MALYRDSEFVDFCNTGKGHTNGTLVMRGESVYSYDMLIAHVNRNIKLITFFGKTVSRTTTRHQNSVLRGHSINLQHSGWNIEKVY
jgi:hypothetical protein